VELPEKEVNFWWLRAQYSAGQGNKRCGWYSKLPHLDRRSLDCGRNFLLEPDATSV